ncbi:MAG TPA: alpha/beta hydrolase [Mycobacteriales bacterium]|nr:alpha/beta hydrolase [Mycobacteriales bacterium]
MSEPFLTVTSGTGTPVVLLPGGAATSHGYFPMLSDALVGRPVICFDRPGTGLQQDSGLATLPGGSAALADVLDQLGHPRVVLVGHSLGGALAVQFAADYPDRVAGMVLLDPTPINDAMICRWLPPLFKVLASPGYVPVIGARLSAGIFSTLGKRVGPLEPAAQQSLTVLLTSADLAVTTKAVRTLPAEGAALTPRLEPVGVPVVLVGADRKQNHRVRIAHEALAGLIGAEVQIWPGTAHALHLQRPREVSALVCKVADEADRPDPSPTARRQ